MLLWRSVSKSGQFLCRRTRHLLIVAAAVLITTPSIAQISSVSLKVDELTTTEKSTGKSTTKQKKHTTLKITVGNMTDKELADVQVRYFLFTKDIEADKPTVAVVGSKRVTLPKSGQEQFESKDASVLYSPRRTEKDKGKNKTIPAFGEKTPATMCRPGWAAWRWASR